MTAVGNAGGTGTLTAAAGTISSLTASVTAASEGSPGTETLAAMIETTADVVSGDSGGPLFDAEGEVVGIDTAASTGAEIDGYAIPIAAGARHRRPDHARAPRPARSGSGRPRSSASS